jgi:hypothetical protein
LKILIEPEVLSNNSFQKWIAEYFCGENIIFDEFCEKIFFFFAGPSSNIEIVNN